MTLNTFLGWSIDPSVLPLRKLQPLSRLLRLRKKCRNHRRSGRLQPPDRCGRPPGFSRMSLTLRALAAARYQGLGFSGCRYQGLGFSHCRYQGSALAVPLKPAKDWASAPAHFSAPLFFSINREKARAMSSIFWSAALDRYFSATSGIALSR